MAPTDRPATSSRGKPGIALGATPAAVEQLKSALATKGGDHAVRLFVSGGAHPSVGMSIDRPQDRDDRLEVKGVPFVIDTGSRPFLDGATVDYVVTSSGAGFSVTGPNTPSAVPPPSSAPAESGGSSKFPDVARAALKQVYDPEIPMNIVDLGLIYDLALEEGGHARVKMTMTTPGCPVIDLLLDQVRAAVKAVPGVSDVDVEIVWEPPWGPDRMSEFAKRQLGFA